MILKIFLITIFSVSSIFALTGVEIAQKVHDRDEGDN